MAKLTRKPVNKRRSANDFNRRQSRTHVNNVKIMRGGWRL